MPTVERTKEHDALKDDLFNLLTTHDQLTDEEFLAIVSQFAGLLVAFQDPERVTRKQAMEMVQENINIGNIVGMAEMSTLRKANAH